MHWQEGTLRLKIQLGESLDVLNGESFISPLVRKTLESISEKSIQMDQVDIEAIWLNLAKGNDPSKLGLVGGQISFLHPASSLKLNRSWSIDSFVQKEGDTFTYTGMNEDLYEVSLHQRPGLLESEKCVVHPEFSLEGTGFHRKLVNKLTLDKDFWTCVQTKFDEPVQICKLQLSILQHIPQGAFVDTYELHHLNMLNKTWIKLYAGNDANVELPYERAGQNVVFVVIDNIKFGDTSPVSFEIPIHLRYQSASHASNKQQISFLSPDVYFSFPCRVFDHSCGIGAKWYLLPESSRGCEPSRKAKLSMFKTINAEVPVGDANSATWVFAATTLFVLAGMFSVLGAMADKKKQA